MASYVASPVVRQELLAIGEFIARDNPEAALRVLDAAEQTFKLLASHPGLGHLRRFPLKAHRTVRSFTIRGFGKYLILYREIAHGIEIIHVYHTARNINALMRRK